MDLRTFADCLAEDLTEILPEVTGTAVTCRMDTVVKLNDVELLGLTLLEEGASQGPTFYMEEYYDRYLLGVPKEELIGDLLSRYEKAMEEKAGQPPDILPELSQMANHLSVRVADLEKNRRFLEKVPYREAGHGFALFCDMRIPTGPFSFWSAAVTHDLLAESGMTETTLFDLAMCNAPLMDPPLLVDCLLDEAEDPYMVNLLACAEPFSEEKAPAYYLSNTTRLQGSAVVFLDGVLEKAGHAIGDDFYLLPCTVDGWMVIPVYAGAVIRQLSDLVRFGNAELEGTTRWLSDRILYYDYLENRLSVAWEAGKRETVVKRESAGMRDMAGKSGTIGKREAAGSRLH